MDRHTVAAISIAGSCLDVLGSLYLAYDLLGGRHGPLRLITRAVTYSIIFGVGYGIGLGPLFGVASGIATGITVTIELSREARGLDHFPLSMEALMSAIRAAAIGVGLYPLVGFGFAAVFALLLTLGQTIAYSRGMRPALDYSADGKPRLTRRQFWGTLERTAGYTATALTCSALFHRADGALAFAIRLGLATGIATAIGVSVTPFIEYYADTLPERRLGVFGIGLMLCGFALQSVQYWLILLA